MTLGAIIIGLSCIIALAVGVRRDRRRASCWRERNMHAAGFKGKETARKRDHGARTVDGFSAKAWWE